MIFKDIRNGRFYNEDCFDAMKEIPDGVIDMILCDLPYGTTQNKWDSLLPLDKLWTEYWRICKSNAAIVLTAAQPFTSKLVISQLNYFKYDWIWHKLGKATGHLNSKKQPMRNKEDILVFYKEQCTYNPQMTEGTPYKGGAGSNKQSGNYGYNGDFRNDNEGSRFPLQIQAFNRIERAEHPTQKPVTLFEYLIKTYTNENELILDNTAGSGTTAIAAINTNRKWVCIEKEKEYYDKAIERISNHGWK
jgi:site-specific DNA-methyltransferase (adenine-specific)